jgi:hypothetical protein
MRDVITRVSLASLLLLLLFCTLSGDKIIEFEETIVFYNVSTSATLLVEITRIRFAICVICSNSQTAHPVDKPVDYYNVHRLEKLSYRICKHSVNMKK